MLENIQVVSTAFQVAPFLRQFLQLWTLRLLEVVLRVRLLLVESKLLSNDDNVDLNYNDRYNGFSTRCVRD